MSGAEVSKFDARLDIVPTDPGVYLMKDASDSVIYVGKAKNLRNRLRSYFGKNPQG
ncbi:MAG: GIY-YIG nuclease family protein, partial [Clostridiales bacterium]|nr:GIY-YIG nuclease family protein [Clostridiales bacterium]